MEFTKMHGAGNDYIYLNCLEHTPEDPAQLARRLSDRHFGVGGDGLICVCPSQRGDFQMWMFNADGSEGAMCGNGIRCLGKYVYDRGLTRKTDLVIETASGLRQVTLLLRDGAVTGATVDMGTPEVGEPIKIDVKGTAYTAIPVSMGNPHCVVEVEDLAALPLAEVGPALERHPSFPDRVNVEFARLLGPGELALRVWERGSGETLACGTGACAALAALSPRCGRSAVLHLPGGDLRAEWSQRDGHIYLTGPAVKVFDGQIDS